MFLGMGPRVYYKITSQNAVKNIRDDRFYFLPHMLLIDSSWFFMSELKVQ